MDSPRSDGGGLVRVLVAGALTTVQDLGRPGHAHLGVSASGAADPVSLRLANRLAGNPEGAGALEMTLLGGTFAFEAPSLVALTGSDFAAAIEGARPRALPRFRAQAIEPGELLKIGATRQGARAYLAIRGGIDVPRVLGSRSTHLMTGMGGLEGRALRQGDLLQLGVGQERPIGALSVAEAEIDAILFRRELRTTPGPEAREFSPESLASFEGSWYEVREEADRMGIRLKGPLLRRMEPRSMTTEGVCLGMVQVPEGGEPIVLFIEQQTTGGYPRIASVISADLPALGQLRPRDRVRFRRVTLAEAHALLREQEALLARAVGASRP